MPLAILGARLTMTVKGDAAEPASCEGSGAAPGRWCYTALELDADAEWLYHRTRWYDPTPGRWAAEDPLGYAADDLNLCRFVSSNSGLLPDADGGQR